MRLGKHPGKGPDDPTRLKGERPSVNHLLAVAAHLDDRDKLLLRMLYTSRTATESQLSRIYCSGENAMSPNQCSDRLKALAEAKLIAAVDVTTPLPSWIEPTTKAWMLDTGGILLAEALEKIPSQMRVTDEERSTFTLALGHNLTVAEIVSNFIGITSRYRVRRGRLVWRLADREESWPPRARYLYPDAVIEIPLPKDLVDMGRRFVVYLEVDMGTERTNEIVNKLRRYKESAKLEFRVREDPAWTPYLPPSSRSCVLFACPTHDRADEIYEIWEWLQKKDQQRHGFAPRDLYVVAVPITDAVQVISQLPWILFQPQNR